MKTNIATTKEQSDRLLRCGVSADTADMCLSTRTRRYDGTFIAKKHQTTNLWVGYPCRRTTSGDEELENVPAWSLCVLLGLLFKSGHILSIQYERNEYRLQSFYSSGDFIAYGTTAIEACVNMVETLTANGYKLNEQ